MFANFTKSYDHVRSHERAMQGSGNGAYICRVLKLSFIGFGVNPPLPGSEIKPPNFYLDNMNWNWGRGGR